MEYIMGIDQGSSKTYVIIGDNAGTILGLGKSHGACHSSTGIEYAMDAVEDAMRQALLMAKVKLEKISVVFAGMTGLDWDFESKLLEDAIGRVTKVKKIAVVNDCIIALRAGSTQTYGAILCAGSGLNCAVRDMQGNEFVYGFYIEEGFQGGSGLGRAAVNAVLDAEIGLSVPTKLTEMLKKEFKCSSVDQLLLKKVSEEITMEDYLRLPILLEEAAHEGDQKSKQIWYEFGIRFGMYVALAAKRMNLNDTDMEVVLSGSIFKCREPELRQGVYDHLKKELPKARLVDARYEPIVGAYLMGLELLPEIGNIDESIVEMWCDKFDLKRLS